MNYFTHAMIHYALLLFLIFRFCTCLDTISIKTNPIRDIDKTFLVSSGETFALGFFGKPNCRYVGIWYHKIPGQTVVWVANRDNPITDSSGFLSIDTTNGNLVLYHNSNINRTDKVVWSTSASSSACSPASDCVAQLLDSGNLVLLHNINKQVIWQSFDHPTNTRLPNMKLGIDRRTGLNRFLTSWKSEDDPGIGNYTYRIDPRGFPQMFLYEGRIPRWRAGPWNGIIWSGVPATAFKVLHNVSFVNDNNEISLMWDVLDPSILSRIVVNESGMFQLFMWQKEGGRGWNEMWSAPADRCEQYGHCGAFGLCDPSIAERLQCTCLPGFEPRSPTQWYMRDANHRCARKPGSLICREGEGFVKVANVKVPDTSRVEVISSGLSLKACEKECLRNCNCTAYARANISEKGSGCILWHGNLVDTRKLTAGDGQDLFVRVDKHDLAKHTKKSKRLLTTILIVSGVSILFSIIFFAYWFLKRKGQHNLFLNDNITYGESSKEKNLGKSKRHLDLPFFDLRTLITATDNFSAANKLGQGGFGSVYKGQLVNGQEIAVKRLSKYSGQGMEEFKNEITVIAKLQHRNLVSLLGCCIHKEEKMLIYEYLPNKSLDYFIYDAIRGSNLEWTKRFEIVIGIARGILYLHQDSRLKIIHRDLKASNVLLDSTMNPKISDFGMARMFSEDQIQTRTNRVVGTYGYMSPEYAMQGLYSTKSDVFSFGVLLLEIITGRKNTDYVNGSPFPNLTGHMWELWKEGRVLDIVDPTLCQPFSAQEVLKCIHIGLLCVQEGATDRPTMSEVISMLTNDTNLPPPNTPAFIFQRQTSHNANSSTSRSKEAVSLNSVTITTLEAR